MGRHFERGQRRLTEGTAPRRPVVLDSPETAGKDVGDEPEAAAFTGVVGNDATVKMLSRK